MPKVYCVAEPIRMENGEPVPLFDLTPAVKFGEIVILLKHNSSVLNTVPLIRALKTKLEGFTAEDYVLPVGDPVLISIVVALCAEQTGGRFNMLKWDKKERTYIAIRVDTSGRAI